MAKTFSYFMTQRPPCPGAMPKRGLVEIEDFDDRIYIDEIDHKAWAKLIYNRKLSAEELRDYELVPEFYDIRLTNADCVNLLYLLEGNDIDDSIRERIANKILEAEEE